MRPGSAINEPEWSLMLYVYSFLQNDLARAQDDAAETWERAYMRKALKEDERRKAAYIHTEVQISLGNRERMCRYHKTADGNNHKDIHCMYNPCHHMHGNIMKYQTNLMV